MSGRDAVWLHPDLLPTADDFDDPDGFVRGREEFDISDLEEEAGPGGGQPQAGEHPEPGGGPEAGGEPDAGGERPEG